MAKLAQLARQVLLALRVLLGHKAIKETLETRVLLVPQEQTAPLEQLVRQDQ